MKFVLFSICSLVAVLALPRVFDQLPGWFDPIDITITDPYYPGEPYPGEPYPPRNPVPRNPVPGDRDDRICTSDFSPVCSRSKRVTFPNSCEASARRVFDTFPGACPKRKENCACGRVFQPVCGYDSVTYSNRCEASCAGIERFTEGECQFVFAS